MKLAAAVLSAIIISLLGMPLRAAPLSQNEISQSIRSPSSYRKQKEIHSQRSLPSRVVVPLHEEPLQGLTPSEAALRELHISPSRIDKE